MHHLKWPSIENSYQEKFIAAFVEEYPLLKVIPYVITEKLHGMVLWLSLRWHAA